MLSSSKSEGTMAIFNIALYYFSFMQLISLDQTEKTRVKLAR